MGYKYQEWNINENNKKKEGTSALSNFHVCGRYFEDDMYNNSEQFIL